MWIVDVACSDDACAEEWEVVVSDLAELDLVACACGCGGVVLRVANFEPLQLAA
jgi:hypothetical protein